MASNYMERHVLDLSRMTLFNCASLPEPVLEYESTEPKKDRATGLPLYKVGVTVRNKDDRKAWTIDIEVPGEPVGLEEGGRVRLFDLSASPWTQEGRWGIKYRASAITAADAPALPAAPAAASTVPDTPAAGRVAGGKAAARE